MTRAATSVFGLAALACAWLLPLGALLPGAFSAHMTMHMMVVAVAAPLLAAGLAGGPLDPVRRWPWAFPPVPASVVELVVVWTWHAPALHHAARHDPACFALEQSSFLASGLFVWIAALGGDAAARPARAAAGLVALLLTSMHMTLLGALLALPPRALYAHASGATALTPLQDQQLGGAIMLVGGGAVYLAGGLVLARELLVRRRTASKTAIRSAHAANAAGNPGAMPATRTSDPTGIGASG